jgi:hypothetical protein
MSKPNQGTVIKPIEILISIMLFVLVRPFVSAFIAALVNLAEWLFGLT